MTAWSIAASDSGAGAGIQADLKTFHSLGVYGCTVLTAATAQNTCEVSRVDCLSPDMVQAQITALAGDMPPEAVKIGLLGSGEIIDVVARYLATTNCPVVCDPVMTATTGARLMGAGTRETFIKALLPRVDLLTPNLPEAEALAEMSIAKPDDVRQAAGQILKLGPKSVLIKGGHGSGPICQDYWTDGEGEFWLNGPRLKTGETHGTGCTLSSAITACLALGHDLKDALVLGRGYLSAAIQNAHEVGGGASPVDQAGWPETLPWVTANAQKGCERLRFPACEPIGFYPIVDSVAWMARLLPMGVKTLQLRIKDGKRPDLEQEIRAAIALAREYKAQLYINDHWRLAMKHGAYGVHLGQEDLDEADLPALAEAGLRLGLSTHTYYELARAIAVDASYLALGPIYQTATKDLAYDPRGLKRLSHWKKYINQPLVAIGGIDLAKAREVVKAGADGIAVISAITQVENPEAQVTQWLKLFR